MSMLNDLIKELCPDSVEYKKLRDVAGIVRGVTYNKQQEDNAVLSNSIPVLRANNIDLNTNKLVFNDIKFVNNSVRISEKQHLIAGDILICAGSGSKEHIGKATYINDDMPEYTFGGFMSVVRLVDFKRCSSKYLFYVMSSDLFKRYLASNLASTTINNLNSTLLANFIFPVPPLKIQQEIVKILDKFTQLQAELQAELDLRLKQYEHYRDELLSFDKLSDLEGGGNSKD